MSRLPDSVAGMLSYCVQAQLQGSLNPSCYMISESIAQACEELGIEAEVMFADAYAWNIDAQRLLKSDRLFRKWSRRDRIGFKARRKMRKIRPKFVGIYNGQDVEGPGYNGHVVVRIEGEMVDCTIHQFTRPDYNLNAPDVAVIPMKEFTDMEDEIRNGDTKTPAGNLLTKTMIDEVSVTPEMTIQPFPNDGGYMLYSIRRGLEKDYFDFSPETRDNIRRLKEDLVRIGQAIIDGRTKLVEPGSE